jgi:hypothetical protein
MINGSMDYDEAHGNLVDKLLVDLSSVKAATQLAHLDLCDQLRHA